MTGRAPQRPASPGLGLGLGRSAAARMLLLGLAALGPLGCAPVIVMTGPPSQAIDDKAAGHPLWVGNAAGPAFQWELRNASPDDDIEYILEVATSDRFDASSVRVRVEGIRGRTDYTLPRGVEHIRWWLPSPAAEYLDDPERPGRKKWVVRETDYWARVEGRRGDETIPCEAPRKFRLGSRDRIQLSVALPQQRGVSAVLRWNGEVVLEKSTAEAEASVLDRALEDGQVARIELEYRIEREAASLKAWGELSAVKVNANILSGEPAAEVVINNLDVALLQRLKGGGVADLEYLIGGDVVVRLRLGGRPPAS